MIKIVKKKINNRKSILLISVQGHLNTFFFHIREKFIISTFENIYPCRKHIQFYFFFLEFDFIMKLTLNLNHSLIFNYLYTYKIYEINRFHKIDLVNWNYNKCPKLHDIFIEGIL